MPPPQNEPQKSPPRWRLRLNSACKIVTADNIILELKTWLFYLLVF